MYNVSSPPFLATRDLLTVDGIYESFQEAYYVRGILLVQAEGI
jgi:hypothetical protein